MFEVFFVVPQLPVTSAVAPSSVLSHTSANQDLEVRTAQERILGGCKPTFPPPSVQPKKLEHLCDYKTSL